MSLILIYEKPAGRTKNCAFTLIRYMDMNEEDTIRILKRRITTAKEMNRQAWKNFPVGSSVPDLIKWLESEGWTFEEWKQSERDKKKGLL